MKDININSPIGLTSVTVTDEFWKQEIETVRTEVIPYQWNALNDAVPGAAPSYCMRNYKVAGKLNEARIKYGKDYGTHEELPFFWGNNPKDPENPGDNFYGFVFQDSDFSKWIEAVAYSLTVHPDPELEKTADEAIDIVCKAQLEDGYLDTFFIISNIEKRFTNLRDAHELYCFGHLTEGAVAYYQATGKDKLLNAARKYADYIYSRFGTEEGKIHGYPGHEIAEMALVRLYDLTKDSKYLSLAKYFVDERGKRPYYFDIEHPEQVRKGEEDKERGHYHQAHRPVREQDEAVGHSVRAVYLYSGMADVARITDDEELFAACNRLWDNITHKRMYVTGGIGSTHMGEAFTYDYDLPNDTAYSETCAAIGLVFFARRMLQIKPDVKYSDVLERALYNGVLSGMALDGKSFFYVNPLKVVPTACKKDERIGHVKPIRQKWFGCACCPPNIARLLSSIVTYAYTENDDTLFFHLYMGGTVKKTFGDKEITFKVDSSFPWNGNVTITCDSETGATGTVALRIPGWCKNPNPLVNEDKLGATVTKKDGYLYITKEWKKNDNIVLSFDMQPILVKANNRVREDAGKLCVQRGPIVYCLEEADNGENLHLLKLDVAKELKVAAFDELGVKGMNCIKAEGYRAMEDEGDLYSEYSEEKSDPCELTFVPYYAWNNRGEGEMSVWVDHN